MSDQGEGTGEQSVEGTEDTERARPQDPAEGPDDEQGPGDTRAHTQEPAEGGDDPAKTGEG